MLSIGAGVGEGHVEWAASMRRSAGGQVANFGAATSRADRSARSFRRHHCARRIGSTDRASRGRTRPVRMRRGHPVHSAAASAPSACAPRIPPARPAAYRRLRAPHSRALQAHARGRMGDGAPGQVLRAAARCPHRRSRFSELLCLITVFSLCSILVTVQVTHNETLSKQSRLENILCLLCFPIAIHFSHFLIYLSMTSNLGLNKRLIWYCLQIYLKFEYFIIIFILI